MVKLSVFCRLDQQMKHLIDTIDRHEQSMYADHEGYNALHTDVFTSSVKENEDTGQSRHIRSPFTLFLIQRA